MLVQVSSFAEAYKRLQDGEQMGRMSSQKKKRQQGGGAICDIKKS